MRIPRLFAATATLAAALASIVPVPAQAYPSGTWRTRNTGLDSDGRCTRRAFSAMKNANLEASASGSIGVYGKTDAAIVYVICMNGGKTAAIFCSSDRPNSAGYITTLCDSVSRQMEP